MNKELHNINIFDVNKEFVAEKPLLIQTDKNGFFLCRIGSVTLSLDDNIFEVRAGDLYIYPPFSQTYIRSISDDMQGVIGVADFDFVISSIALMSDSKQHLYLRTRPCVTLLYEQRNRIEELIAIIKNRLAESKHLFRSQILSTLTQTICFEILDAYFSGYSIKPSAQKRKDVIFHHFLQDVFAKFKQHRDVKFYAGQQCLTPRYFATVIREISGKTPSEWINIPTIAEIKHLLNVPDLSIKEIAEQLHFTDQSLLGRYFKNLEGISPQKYREQHNRRQQHNQNNCNSPNKIDKE